MFSFVIDRFDFIDDHSDVVGAMPISTSEEELNWTIQHELSSAVFDSSDNDAIAESCLKWAEENKEAILAACKEFLADNPDYIEEDSDWDTTRHFVIVTGMRKALEHVSKIPYTLSVTSENALRICAIVEGKLVQRDYKYFTDYESIAAFAAEFGIAESRLTRGSNVA